MQEKLFARHYLSPQFNAGALHRSITAYMPTSMQRRKTFLRQIFDEICVHAVMSNPAFLRAYMRLRSLWFYSCSGLKWHTCNKFRGLRFCSPAFIIGEYNIFPISGFVKCKTLNSAKNPADVPNLLQKEILNSFFQNALRRNNATTSKQL